MRKILVALISLLFIQSAVAEQYGPGPTPGGTGFPVTFGTTVISGNSTTPAISGLTLSSTTFATSPVSSVSPINFTIASSGGDFTNFDAAVNYLKTIFIAPGTSITLTGADGTYALSAPLNISNRYGLQFTIQGQHTYSHSVTSVQSSSGSAGARSIIVNVDSVANVAVNDYVVGSVMAGGTNPTYLDGTFKVTNVDGVNTRLTLLSPNNAAAAPSGAVTGTLTVIKTIITFANSDGLQVWSGGSAVNLDKIEIVGDGSGGHNGLSIQDVGRLFIPTVVGVSNFGGADVYANYNSEINADGMLAASGGGTCFQMLSSAAIDLAVGYANGCTSDNVVAIGAYVHFATGGSTGATGKGFSSTANSIVQTSGTFSTGNSTYGYYADSQGFIDDTSTTVANNGTQNSLPAFQAVTEILSGNLSAPAWTTSGVRLKVSAGTVTDTSSSGTVANVYMNAIGTQTLAASSSMTATSLYNVFISPPAAGTNVTATTLVALGLGGRLDMTGNSILNAGTIISGTACSFRFAGGATSGTVPDVIPCNNDTTTGMGSSGSGAGSLIASSVEQLHWTSGGVSLPTITTGTNADFVCMTAGFVFVIQSSACTISSERFKTGVKNFAGDMLPYINKLRVVTFKMKAKNRDANGNAVQLGLLAEDVAKVMPICAIYESDMKTPKSYRQECVIAGLVKSMQQLSAANDNLSKRLAKLERRR